MRKDITAWMKWLRNNVGFDGWRFDFVKGYGMSCIASASTCIAVHSLLRLVWFLLGSTFALRPFPTL